MTPNKRDLKAYTRFDGTGRIVPGSTVLRRNKPKNGKWKEVQAYECCIPPTCTEPLIMQFRPAYQQVYFQLRVFLNNKVKGTVDWGDGTTETFDLTNYCCTYTFSHTYSTADYNSRTVKTYFESTDGIEGLYLGDWSSSILTLSNATTVFAGSTLERVDVSYSDIYNLDLHDLTNITQVFAYGCPQLSYINVLGCTNVIDLEVDESQIVNLDVTGLTSLEYLTAEGIDVLENIIIDGCPNLQYVYANNCALTTSNVDYIITTLDGNGLTGGYLYLNGGTSGAPSGAVSANITSLESKGWDIHTN